MAVRYGTVRYASIFAKKYGTLVRYSHSAKVRVRYVGTQRWNREHKALGQGQGPRTQMQVFS